jgi:hypothetical protein
MKWCPECKKPTLKDEDGKCMICGYPRAKAASEVFSAKKQARELGYHSRELAPAGGCDLYNDCLNCIFPKCANEEGEMPKSQRQNVKRITDELARCDLDWQDVGNYLVDIRGKLLKGMFLYASTKDVLSLIQTIAQWKKYCNVEGRWVFVREEDWIEGDTR